MTRSRSIAAALAALGCAGLLVAGCGGSEGFTASEEAPSSAAGQTTTAAQGQAPADPASQAIGAFPASDPASGDPSFSGYQQFPKDRAGKIFDDLTPKPPAPEPTPTPTTTVPAPTTNTTTTTTTPTPTAATTEFVATLDVSGVTQSAKVGDQVPADAPQFTVQAITSGKVTLKLNTGTLPGGATTVEIAKGESVTLSNPTTGASFVVKVVEIAEQAV
jgi:hypothetical protein